MKKLMRMFTKSDENYEFQLFLKEVEKAEELKVKEYENRSTYVNPGALRSGIKQGAGLSFLVITTSCPA